MNATLETVSIKYVRDIGSEFDFLHVNEPEWWKKLS